jgi:AraC-like DNA-binding protein
MHKEAHGDLPTRIIEVDASLVESFLGRIEDPDTELNIIDETAFRTIVAVDMKKATLPKNSPATLHTPVKHFCKEVADILHVHRGTIVEQTDYHFLVSFKSVSNAVNAAFKISGVFRKLNTHFIKERIVLKMGISAGVPVTEKKLLFEDAVKLAKRMCEVVKGEMIMSAEVNYLYKEENADFPSETKEMVSLTANDEQFLTGLMDYIESAWNNSNFSVANLNRPLGCSKSKLYRKILFLTGKSPSTFIKDYRLQEALKLLEKNAGNVSEIAFETGFSSPSYFSKCFREKYGCFPSSQLFHHIS